MDRYTIKQSGNLKFLGVILDKLSKFTRIIYRFYLWKALRLAKLHGNLKKKGKNFEQLSKGITFTILKVTLLDRNILRITIQDVSNRNKYFVYHNGRYANLYLEYGGKDLPTSDEHYFLCASLYDEWVLV